jgi:centrosomal protein CEP76
VDLTHQGGTLGVIQLHLDLIPILGKNETLNEESVMKQLSLEKRFETESLQKFLEYANEWWAEFKAIRHSHKTRLVKIFAETDDREASIYKPVCSLVQPMIADRLIDTPLHAARFVSLIPFHRLEAPGKDKVEVWHSMQSFLARVSPFKKANYTHRDAETRKITLCYFAISCLASVLKPMW